jgi:hypothetical protein
MTEAEWMEYADPEPMLGFLRGKAGERKLRLFAVACCRRVWHALTDERSRRAVEAAESYADAPDPAELDRARREAEAAVDDATAFERTWYMDPYVAMFRNEPDAAVVLAAQRGVESVAAVARMTRGPAADRPGFRTVTPDPDPDVSCQCQLIRDVFGNPFLPVVFPPDWRTDTTVSLAKHFYDSRDFSAMPILADALQDAGCDSADILDHCRGPGPHVRGCWVVDLVLAKE